ncbi:hypothetical protein V8E54_005828, partial [Elaphomyces granulatus]
IINVGLLVFAKVRSNRGFHSGIGTLLQDKCSNITRYNIGAHLVINVLSTLLLSGSNYWMQCLSAPTRREIDNAHKRGISLDIGIPSLRNLAVLNRWKVLIRSYNSVIFASVGANNYMVFSVNQTIIESHDFLDSLSWDEAPILKSTLAGRLDRLENEQCIRSYATMFLSS